MTRRIFRSMAVAASFAAVVCLHSTAYAGGFALLEQSAEGLGVGYAGAAAGYGDGSAVYYNPAAMSSYRKSVFSVGSALVIPSAKFHNDGSSMVPELGGAPLKGDNDGDGGQNAFLPSLYMVHPLDDGFTLGFAVNTPFGLETKYSDGWVGRYSAIHTNLETFVFSPAVSYQFNEHIAVGGALNIGYADAEISNAIDFGTVGLTTLGLPAASRLGLLPQSADGSGKLTGDDWHLGGTFGLMITPNESTRVGLSYRSQIDYSLRGKATFDVPQNAQILTQGGYFTDTGGAAHLTVPDSISLGVHQQVTDSFALLGETQWTRWSHFKELRVRFENGQPDAVTDESWKDVWRFSVGAEYKLLEKLTLRTGFTYDRSPVPDDEHRTPRIPDNDRYWLAVGASYEFIENLSADLAYAHLFVPGVNTNVVSGTGNQLEGSWDLAIDIVSLQLVWKM